MCASWLARYGENPKARPAQMPANVDPVSRRAEKKREEPRERVGEQEADVVGGDGVDASQLQRGCDEAQAEQVLG